MWHVVHLGIDDAQMHQRDRAAGFAAHFDLPLDIPIAHLRLQLRQGEDRAGLGHAIAGEDIDAHIERLLA